VRGHRALVVAAVAAAVAAGGAGADDTLPTNAAKFTMTRQIGGGPISYATPTGVVSLVLSPRAGRSSRGQERTS
jgi:hypothetical protein